MIYIFKDSNIWFINLPWFKFLDIIMYCETFQHNIMIQICNNHYYYGNESLANYSIHLLHRWAVLRKTSIILYSCPG